MDNTRIRILNDKPIKEGPILYWMFRDQRVQDNWAFVHAQKLAMDAHVPLVVLFTLVKRGFEKATLRQYDFMLRGLQEVDEELEKLNIPLYVFVSENPADEVLSFSRKMNVGCIITDFFPVNAKQAWNEKLRFLASCAVQEIDAHNIVPCWEVSQKQEFGAYTLRPKIHKLLADYLKPIPKTVFHPYNEKEKKNPILWQELENLLEIDRSVKAVDWIAPGAKAAHRAMEAFIQNGINGYEELRNNPTKEGQSGLSPYLHFGQLSAQLLAYTIHNQVAAPLSEMFLEELIVRRELADNFCYYNPHYCSVDGFPAWAKATLAKHMKDERSPIYTLKEFECANTEDPLWNAAQQEMLQTGKMHGYMRMYWAKKILEWTKTPDDAMKIAIYLNDKYELDGRDPNGYAGIAWSIGGVHDRAWFERPVYGKIRYMNSNGCKRKFKVQEYIDTWTK